MGFSQSLFMLEGARARLQAMTNSLTPRGPDAAGFFTCPEAFLGHRRLAVVDLEGGRQPMSRDMAGRRCTLVYNGELYNTAEVRAELAALGYSHATQSDTETVLLAYMAWGQDCPKHFNGIFAFAVFDEGDSSLFVARDRFGIKPFFYTEQRGLFLFASEHKALLASGLVQPRVGREGLCEVFGLFPTRTPGCGVYENVYELKPGHFGRLTRGGFSQKPYWELNAAPHMLSEAETVSHVRELVSDAIRRQLVSDVPLCTFLSGGLDSSIISAAASLAMAEKGETLHTYSIEHRDNSRYFRKSLFQPEEDAPYARLMSEALQSQHHVYQADGAEGLVAALAQAARARDLPGMADIDASLLLFCREIKKSFTVALSGECADEIFGGYPWFHSEKAFATPNFPWVKEGSERDQVLCRELAAVLDIPTYVKKRYEESVQTTPRLPGEEKQEARRREIRWLNINWFMANLLERKDRMSMYSGLEVRVPFCDHRIVEYAYNVPWELLSLHGREKGLLREAFSHQLPEEITWRKKSPYPKTHNPAYEQAVKAALLERLSDSPLRPLLNMPRLFTLMATPGDTATPWFGQLMARAQLYAFLLQTDEWLRSAKVELAL